MDKKELKEVLNDHDLLIEMHTQLSRLILDHDNHLRHHWIVSAALLSVTLISISTALIAVFIK